MDIDLPWVSGDPQNQDVCGRAVTRETAHHCGFKLGNVAHDKILANAAEFTRQSLEGDVERRVATMTLDPNVKLVGPQFPGLHAQECVCTNCEKARAAYRSLRPGGEEYEAFFIKESEEVDPQDYPRGCTICWGRAKTADTILRPCGCYCICFKCAKQRFIFNDTLAKPGARTCPTCKEKVTGVQRTHIEYHDDWFVKAPGSVPPANCSLQPGGAEYEAFFLQGIVEVPPAILLGQCLCCVRRYVDTVSVPCHCKTRCWACAKRAYTCDNALVQEDLRKCLMCKEGITGVQLFNKYNVYE